MKMLIPTVFREDKLFVEISEPYELKKFIEAAKSVFQIYTSENITASVFGAKVREDQLGSIVLQYMSTPTFQIELQIGGKNTAFITFLNNVFKYFIFI